MDKCISCPQGTYQDTIGQTECLPCSRGRYNDQLGQVACPACPSGSFSPELAMPACRPCPEYTTSPIRSSSIGDCVCRTGTYRIAAGLSPACVQCPAGAECAGAKTQPRSLPGYRVSQDLVTVNSRLYEMLECTSTQACPGDDRCGDHFVGPVCGACTEGYRKYGNSCIKCSMGTTVLALSIFFLFLFPFCGLIVLLANQSSVERMRRNVKFGTAFTLVLEFFQFNATLASLHLSWPGYAPMDKIAFTLRISMLDHSIFGWECISGFTYEMTLMLRVLTLILVQVVFVMIYGLCAFHDRFLVDEKKDQKQEAPPKGKGEMELDTFSAGVLSDRNSEGTSVFGSEGFALEEGTKRIGRRQRTELTKRRNIILNRQITARDEQLTRAELLAGKYDDDEDSDESELFPRSKGQGSVVSTKGLQKGKDGPTGHLPIARASNNKGKSKRFRILPYWNEKWNFDAPQFVNAASMSTNILYFFTLGTSLEVFDCYSHPNQTKHSLTAYPNIFCYTDSWYNILPIGVACLLLFGLGIPLMHILIFTMTSPDDPKVISYFGSLWKPYRLIHAQWGMVVMAKRTIFLVGLWSLRNNLAPALTSALIVVTAFTIIEAWIQPFLFRHNFQLSQALSVLFCIELVTVLSVVLPGSSGTIAGDIAIFIGVVGSFTLGVAISAYVLGHHLLSWLLLGPLVVPNIPKRHHAVYSDFPELLSLSLLSEDTHGKIIRIFDTIAYLRFYLAGTSERMLPSLHSLAVKAESRAYDSSAVSASDPTHDVALWRRFFSYVHARINLWSAHTFKDDDFSSSSDSCSTRTRRRSSISSHGVDEGETVFSSTVGDEAPAPRSYARMQSLAEIAQEVASDGSEDEFFERAMMTSHAEESLGTSANTATTDDTSGQSKNKGKGKDTGGQRAIENLPELLSHPQTGSQPQPSMPPPVLTPKKGRGHKVSPTEST
eukprot:TRINITY_DN1370_c0_g1_i3.p1 TRINITY_DN1370_c0_g1~~TRINITY_DN1370_c0_g1_i3.p1  ORF type:complete len:946 (-),score=118.85 TRINITY_DN1370_c0_g1_i3:26-2863(-)